MQFKDPAGTYSGGYTSEIVMPNTNNNPRGVVQVNLTSGSVDLQGRADSSAPFVSMKTYTTSGLDEVVLAPYMRIFVSSDSDGVGYLAETN
tara:strand:- start:349 stop:621 length:273 start_codon:yes stop_codon:yes gene_type:complete